MYTNIVKLFKYLKKGVSSVRGNLGLFMTLKELLHFI